MLRNCVLAFGAIALLAGALAVLAGARPGLVALCWGAVVVFSIVFERTRYKPVESGAPGPGWTKTPERFIDEGTGQQVTVWIDPKSGERKYVRS